MGASYNFSDLQLPGLDVSANYIHGSGIKDLTASDLANGTDRLKGERETYLTASYSFQDGALKGVKLRAVQVWCTQKYAAKKDIDSSNTRLYIDYTVSVF